MLKVKELTVCYGRLPALKEVSLEVQEGEVVSLIGPNGAGKTTLLLTISGILERTEGRISFRGEDITDLNPHQIVTKGIGHVPQGRHIFPTLSVLDNLLLGGYRKRRGDITDDLEWVYHLFPILDDRGHQRAGTLSGGEQQMLAIGRALMTRPTLLLLDEPSLGLAPGVTEDIFSAFEEMNKRGLTILIVEQEARFSLAISHRGYLLRSGWLIKEGPAAELRESQEVKSLYLGQGGKRA
ncbi:MAG: ABC transporter ATP-binding protein [Deltaproteobacteria bacterium]|nr:MAG: ABC transporter ATP-binding protein [Deltaproteobacteria bacterium]